MPLIASELDPIAAELSVGDMDSDQVLLHLLESLLVAFSYPWFLALLGCMTFFPPRKCWFEALILILGGLLMGGYLFAGRVIRNLHHMFQPSAAYLAVVSVLLALEVVSLPAFFGRLALKDCSPKVHHAAKMRVSKIPKSQKVNNSCDIASIAWKCSKSSAKPSSEAFCMFHVPGPALRANLAHSELIPVQKKSCKDPILGIKRWVACTTSEGLDIINSYAGPFHPG